jgi:hypothetical protein
MVTWIGGLATGNIELRYLGKGIGPDPTKPGILLQPTAVKNGGEWAEYDLSQAIISNWLQDGDPLPFQLLLESFAAVGAGQGWINASQPNAGKLPATDSNGNPANDPSGDVNLGNIANGASIVTGFSVALV